MKLVNFVQMFILFEGLKPSRICLKVCSHQGSVVIRGSPYQIKLYVMPNPILVLQTDGSDMDMSNKRQERVGPLEEASTGGYKKP